MEFHVSKAKLLGLLILALGLLAIGLLISGFGSLRAQLAGWASVAFLGGGAGVLLWQSGKPGRAAAVAIDESGIHDRRMQTGPVPRDDIERIWIGLVHSPRLLCVATRGSGARVAGPPAAGSVHAWTPPRLER